MKDSDNISQYRSRLDQTLSSDDLVDYDKLKSLVKNQILRVSECDLHECSENIVDRRTKEVANFLSMLRSASVTDSEASHGGWKGSLGVTGKVASMSLYKSWKKPLAEMQGKVKQDSEEIRVMYREGPEGTPYHTLLAEGYVDGPIDVCLCISWETELYKKWWPQTTIPTFKIATSQCLQRIRTDEQICLVRMKLSRPLSAREAVVHLFAFEYFQDGLIVVVANTISDLDSVDRSTHCYSKDEIHNVQNVVQVDLVGGFALQKVTDNRSYFRTIGNMDIKLDFIPPALINFVARQLIGGGFNLYKKEVASVAKGDEDFSKALKDPLYTRIREALYSNKIPSGDIALQLQDLKKNAVPLKEETRTNYDEKCPEQKVHSEIEVIEDEACEKMKCQNKDDRNIHDSPFNQLVQKKSKNENVRISPEVKHALETLDKAISIIRENRCNLEIRTVRNNNIMSLEAEADSLKDRRSVGYLSEVFEQEFREVASYEHNNSSCSRCMSSSLCTMEPSHNKIAPALPDVYAAIPGDEAHHIALCASTDQETAGKIMEKILQKDNVTVANEDGIHEKELDERKIRKVPRYCCLYFLSGKVVA